MQNTRYTDTKRTHTDTHTQARGKLRGFPNSLEICQHPAYVCQDSSSIWATPLAYSHTHLDSSPHGHIPIDCSKYTNICAVICNGSFEKDDARLRPKSLLAARIIRCDWAEVRLPTSGDPRRMTTSHCRCEIFYTLINSTNIKFITEKNPRFHRPKQLRKN